MPNDGNPPIVDPVHPPQNLVQFRYYPDWDGYYDENWQFQPGQPPELQ